MAVSFTSEAASREGEPKEPPPELKVQMEEMAALSVGEAVGRRLLARRKPGVRIPSPPPHP
jgi:hypothetical protein